MRKQTAHYDESSNASSLTSPECDRGRPELLPLGPQKRGLYVRPAWPLSPKMRRLAVRWKLDAWELLRPAQHAILPGSSCVHCPTTPTTPYAQHTLCDRLPAVQPAGIHHHGQRMYVRGVTAGAWEAGRIRIQRTTSTVRCHATSSTDIPPANHGFPRR